MNHFVYILYYEKLDRFYVGETADFEERMVFHENSEAKKFTAKAKDWELFFKFECGSKYQRKQVEFHIKKMKNSTYIENLKKYPEMVQKLLDKYKC